MTTHTNLSREPYIMAHEISLANLIEPRDRIRWSMERLKLKVNAPTLARKTGINEVTARSYLNGGRVPPLEPCLIIGSALGVSGFWIFDARQGPVVIDNPVDAVETNNVLSIPRRPTSKYITVYSAGLAGPDGEIELMAERSKMVAAPISLEQTAGAYGVKVVGESMKERFREGDTVFVNPDDPIARGDDVVAQIYSDTSRSTVFGLIKRFVHFDADELALSQLNPAREIRYPRSRIKSVHRITDVTFR